MITDSTLSMRKKKLNQLTEILNNNLRTFNDNHKVKLVYAYDGSNTKGLMFEGTNTFIVGKMTKSQAIDTISFLSLYLNRLEKK